MVAKPRPQDPTDMTPEEKARRNACIEQAWRIRAYLPRLRAREETLEQELKEIKTLIADELRAFDGLVFESDSTLEQIARREVERAA